MFRRRSGSVVVGVALVVGALISGSPAGAAERGGADPAAEPALIPVPSSVDQLAHQSFLLRRDSRIVTRGDSVDVARHLAQILRPSTGFELPVTDGRPGPGSGPLRAGDVVLRAGDGGETERYRLLVKRDRVTLSAPSAEGLFRGVQTLRQLFPPQVEGDAVVPGPWTVSGIKIVDRPRFEWRGTHLDVARHFFTVDEVKRYIDLLELYKVNVLHLHLSDDQGWRIMIESWPRLATHGGSIEVGGTPGGYYTHEEYEEIVRYAADRYLTVVPEIDTPGHTNAALASYAELNCDGIAPPLYDGIDVGFSSLCIDKEITYEWFDDVVSEVAELSPGPYFHLGGDEAHETSDEDYLYYLERAQPIVNDHGKRVMGWVDIAKAPLAPGSIAQYWYPASGSEEGTELARMAADQGAKVVMSPANKAYLDMKYDENTPLGLSWAGFVEVEDSYDWDPANFVDGVGEEDVIGVEAALWSETLLNIDHIEFMAFPRLAGIAEIGWSPATGRAWDEYRLRLAAHGPRWEAMGVDFYHSPQVPWE